MDLNNNAKSIRMHGFDYLKIFFAISLVAWHTKALGQANFFMQLGKPAITDLIYGNVFLLAVPVFFLMSFYLYLYNRGSGYFKKRVYNIFLIFVVWNLLAIAIFENQNTLSSFLSPSFWLRGGYGHLYFLYYLLILTIFLEGFTVLKEKVSKNNFYLITIPIFLISLAVMLTKPFLINILPVSVTKYFVFLGPIDFFCYILVALFAFENQERIKKASITVKRYCCLFGALISGLAIWMEYYLFAPRMNSLNFGTIFPPYSRMSVFIMSVMILLIILNLKLNASKIISFLSSLTMGVYLTHFLILEILVVKYPNYFAKFEYHRLLLFVLVLIISILTSMLIKRTKIV